MASVLSSLVNFSTSIPASFANFCGFWNILVMSCENTVADVASSCMFWSRADARPIISDCAIFAWLATPERSAVKSTIYPAFAEELCARSLTAEPVASMAPRKPKRSLSPNMVASFPILSTAPCPRSSPSATFILSAASTNSSIFSLLCMPKRPAASASWFSSVREVRVSSFLKSSFISSTCPMVCPVYFVTLYISWFISA